MAVTLDELRDQRKKLNELQIAEKEIELQFGELKLEQLRRENSYERAQGAERRVMTFAAPISKRTVEEAIRVLDVWSSQTPGVEITVILNSEGGEVIQGFALHDFLRDLSGRGHKITVKVIGCAMSMAVSVLQAGDDRVISPNSWLLIHESSNKFDDVVMGRTQMEEHAAITAQLEAKMLDIMAGKSRMTASQIKRKWKNKEWMIDAEEALKLGFVDRIEA